jgi:hypothetical protein
VHAREILHLKGSSDHIVKSARFLDIKVCTPLQLKNLEKIYNEKQGSLEYLKIHIKLLAMSSKRT